jgi:hypothetical protein
MSDEHRFVETRETIYDLMDEILAVCPRCAACARIAPKESQVIGPFAPRRVVCLGCGFTREWAGQTVGIDGAADPMRDSYFHLPLWLQTDCCGQTLWAYNHRHLTLLEGYIRATLRTREKDPAQGWSNSSFINRLPEWMIVAKHREPVLKAIAKLKARL